MKTLVILAAGIGSRFGGGIKQLEPIDKNGHLIIDYSIHDAIAAGYERIIFVIRHDLEKDFEASIGRRIRDVCRKIGVSVEYAFQEIGDIPTEVPAGRIKPWGTGQAVLACKSLIEAPFSVINADDYYGKNSFRIASDVLDYGGYAVIGYLIGNTLSENGGVTRAILEESNGFLKAIREVKGIVKDGEKAFLGEEEISPFSVVSMNFWCYPKEFPEILEKGFAKFLGSMKDPKKDEYLLPVIAGDLLEQGVQIRVIPTSDRWFGTTYKEDKPFVESKISRLIKRHVYVEDLYGDLPFIRQI